MEKSKFSEEKTELNKKRGFYGITLSIAATLGLFTSSINPILTFLYMVIILCSKEKSSETIKQIGILHQVEACDRLSQKLRDFFGSKGTISSWLYDERLAYGRDGLDCLVNLSSGATFALSVRAIVPPKEGYTKVSFSSGREQLAYRKLKTGLRYFGEDPIQSLLEKTEWLYQNRQELFNSQPIPIVVIAEPSQLEIKQNSPVIAVGEREYIYWNNVYVVAESDTLELINALDQQQSEQPEKELRVG
jgi:hypothetical protein